jgi:hypothetical protein
VLQLSRLLLSGDKLIVATVGLSLISPGARTARAGTTLGLVAGCDASSERTYPSCVITAWPAGTNARAWWSAAWLGTSAVLWAGRAGAGWRLRTRSSQRSIDGQAILKALGLRLETEPDLAFRVELRGFEPRTSCMPYETSR